MSSAPKPPDDIAAMIAEAERRLCALDQERGALVSRLDSLREKRQEAATPAQTAAVIPAGPVTKDSPAPEKLALFRRLFRGREDVYPRRWENPKTGRSGYQPELCTEAAEGKQERGDEGTGGSRQRRKHRAGGQGMLGGVLPTDVGQDPRAAWGRAATGAAGSWEAQAPSPG